MNSSGPLRSAIPTWNLVLGPGGNAFLDFEAIAFIDSDEGACRKRSKSR
jgi:hypothetical protein